MSDEYNHQDQTASQPTVEDRLSVLEAKASASEASITALNAQTAEISSKLEAFAAQLGSLPSEVDFDKQIKAITAKLRNHGIDVVAESEPLSLEV